jgi:hypothetical protein
MRRIAATLSAVLLALSATASIAAQDWIEVTNREDRFNIVFPAEPAVEDVEWVAEDGTTVSGHRYSASAGDFHYSLTVYDYRPADFTAMMGSMAHHATAYRRTGEVSIDAYAQMDRISGHQLQLTTPDGREKYVAFYLHDSLLYITESDIPNASPRGTIFQHSLSIIDENGVRVRYNRDGTRNYERQLGD